jgi:hypothetical protein
MTINLGEWLCKGNQKGGGGERPLNLKGIEENQPVNIEKPIEKPIENK